MSDVIDTEGFRANVGIVLMRDDGSVFLGRRARGGGWQFPQGGIAILDQSLHTGQARQVRPRERRAVDARDDGATLQLIELHPISPLVPRFHETNQINSRGKLGLLPQELQIGGTSVADLTFLRELAAQLDGNSSYSPHESMFRCISHNPTPNPSPHPQGGGEQTECAAR